nr:MAG TPA: hypothetical protein [Bacteriophage sp.]
MIYLLLVHNMMVNIQSVSDVITNSSSEVFVIYNQEGINTIKNLVNSILKLSESKYSCDDLFDIQFKWDDIAEEYYNDDGGLKRTGKTLEEYRQCLQDERLQYMEGAPMIIGIKVIPKLNIPECKEAAKILSTIDNIFKSDVFYC